MEPNRSCPCYYVKPCQPDCTCVVPPSSAGCHRCCSYGSDEQRRMQAERLAKSRRESSAGELTDILQRHEDRIIRLERTVADAGRALKQMEALRSVVADFCAGVAPPYWEALQARARKVLRGEQA